MKNELLKEIKFKLDKINISGSIGNSKQFTIKLFETDSNSVRKEKSNLKMNLDNNIPQRNRTFNRYQNNKNYLIDDKFDSQELEFQREFLSHQRRFQLGRMFHRLENSDLYMPRYPLIGKRIFKSDLFYRDDFKATKKCFSNKDKIIKDRIKEQEMLIDDDNEVEN